MFGALSAALSTSLAVALSAALSIALSGALIAVVVAVGLTLPPSHVLAATSPPSAQSGSHNSGQGPFDRVPASSWVYGAVAQFAKLGLVDGYNERSFSGDRTYTRYEFACIVSRLTSAIETGHPVPVLSSKQRELLKKLRAEFVAELAMVSAQNVTLGEDLSKDGKGAAGDAVGTKGSPGDLRESLDRAAGTKGLPVPDLDEHLTFPSRFALDPGAGVTLSDVLSGKPSQGSAQVGAAPDQTGQAAGGAGTSRGASGSRAVTLLSQDRLKAELKIPVPPAPSDGVGTAKDPGGIPLARDGSKISENDESEHDLIAAVGLEYALSKLASVTAGYELAQVPHSGEGQSKTRGTATVGIDYSLLLGDSAFLRAGYSYSRSREQSIPGVSLGKGAGVSLELDLPFLWQGLPQEGIQVSGESTSATTSFGIGYSLGRDTLLSLGYKLIDFAEAGGADATHKRTNMATAELTIRF